ncbi:hypothetical protein N7526_002859 [Penicillium atrosanguineum]|nr:hypothetical protein N7526_002859 [Penicillium atrosanguineum]
MECFRQIYRCIKSPFIRKSEQGRILHISSPTDFRKEGIARLLLGRRHPDVPEEPRSSEGRDEHRDDALPAVSQGEDPEPSPENEHQTVPVRFRDRLRPSRWLSPVRSSTPASSHERQASSNELEMYTTAEEKPKEI